MIHLNRELKGSILDIGGGGEGFIGRAYGAQVLAIDRSREELDEAPGDFEKVVMDATDLQFEDGHFDNATFFYTLLYMTVAEQEMAISEAARVLKHGGTLAIWDCEIACAYPEPFLADVDVLLDGQTHHTTYGIVKMDKQDRSSIERLCTAAGLRLVKAAEDAGHFMLSFEK